MKNFSMAGLILSLLLLSYLLLKPSPDENDFDSPEFQSHVFNTNILFKTKEKEATYFSGTLLKHKGKTYILSCCHGIEEIENLELLEALHISYDSEGNIIEFKSLPIQILNFSKSEENGGTDLALFEVLDNEFTCCGAAFTNIKLRPKDKIVCIGNTFGTYTSSVYEGTITKQLMNLHDGWPDPFFITSCEVRNGCSGGGVFTKRGGKYYYCGMINRSDLRGIGMFKPVNVIYRWLEENGLEGLING